MEIGLTKNKTTMVGPEKTAEFMGSGDLPVFATPAMIALMEEAAADCVREKLEPGQTTVGTRMDVSHSASTPVGATVTATAKLTKVEGRILYFQVRAEDDSGQIGEGVHQRVIVDVERFMEKTAARGQ